MPTPARIVTIALALTCAVTMSGCTQGDAAPTVSAEPSVTPVFASEEEALAAATEAYAAYISTSDLITAEAGSAPQRIDPYVTTEHREIEHEGFAGFRESTNKTVGISAFDSLQLQQFDPSATVNETISIYLCLDVSQVRLVDSLGVDVTPDDRRDRTPLEVDFVIDAANPSRLLIDRSEVWSGQNFC